MILSTMRNNHLDNVVVTKEYAGLLESSWFQ